MNQPTPPPDVTPELRSAYLRVAAQVLLRPAPSREQDRSSSGLQGKYLVIKRLTTALIAVARTLISGKGK